MIIKFPEETLKKSGIYAIKVRGGSCAYIGSTSNFKNRFRDHASLLKRGLHHCKGLQNAVNKHGYENTYAELLELCELDDLIEKEQFWINNFPSIYNSIRKVCEPFRGRITTEEMRENMRRAQLGKIVSEESRKKMSDSRKGKVFSHEVKLKRSKIRLGIKTKANSSGHVGVREVSSGKWEARGQFEMKPVQIGTFVTEQEAIQAYENFIQNPHLPIPHRLRNNNSSGFEGVGKDGNKWKGSKTVSKGIKVTTKRYNNPEDAYNELLEKVKKWHEINT